MAAAETGGAESARTIFGGKSQPIRLSPRGRNSTDLWGHILILVRAGGVKEV
jgi:hypothetical protein